MEFLRYKRLKSQILVFLVGMFLQSCFGGYSGNEDDVSESLSGITYPDDGTYGKNLLSKKDFTISTNTGVYYSLRVDKEFDSTVKVIFPIPESLSHMWRWYPSTLTGWYEGPGSSGEVGSYRNYITETGSLYSDLKIYFSGSDSVTIEIYENGVTTPTRTKIISW